MSRKVHVDQDECIGCGTCEGICPEVFQLNEETGTSQVIKPESTGRNECSGTSGNE
jgi:ferredoxin